MAHAAALGRVPRVHPEAGVQRVGGRLMAATADEHLHTFEDEAGTVSEVAERIVELCDGRRTVADIIKVLCEEFEVERAVCERDTLEFLNLLAQKQVVVFG